MHSKITKFTNKQEAWLYTILFTVFIGVLFTHPFLKLPFDPWEHLIKIRSIFDEGKCFLYWPDNTNSFCSWHLTWAKFFSIAKISDTFLWAKIIHSTQFIFAILCLLYFSFSVFRLCDKNTHRSHILLIAFFATLYWLLGNGTYSVGYQQAWIMWYSVTYQGLTIPMFWLITGITLQLFFNNELSRLKKPIYVILILSGFLIIAIFHPSEAIYYAIYLFLCLLFTPLISIKQKIISACLFLTIIPCILFTIATYLNLPFLLGVSTHSSFTDLLQQIATTGNNIVERGGNRLHNSFSELAMVSTAAGVIYWFFNLVFLRNKPNKIIFPIIAALILFFLIPTFTWFAGVTGLLLHENIVWRFFFASPWFLFIPLIVLKITSCCRFSKTYAFLILFAILSATFFASQTYLHKALSGNIHSLYNSFSREKVGPQYTAETLALLKQTIEQQTIDIEKKDVMLYLRSDLATLARALYGYYTFSYRRTFIPMHQFYTNRMEQQYKLIPINLPLNFPKDRDIFLNFKLDSKSISCPKPPIYDGTKDVLFSLDHVDLGKKYLFIEGWAFLKEQLSESSVFVVLQSKQKSFMFDTSKLFRKDVGKHFGLLQLENSGFLTTIKTSDVIKGTYRIGILVKQNDEQGFILSKRTVIISD